MSTTLNNITAAKEYEYSNSLAQLANEKAKDAQATLAKYNEEAERINNWNRIMSVAPVNQFFLLYIIITIAEFYFSQEIYKVALPRFPWLVAIALAAIGIFISESISYLCANTLRTWKRYELNRDKNNDHLSEDEMTKYINSFSRTYFIVGVIISLIVLGVIYGISARRVFLEGASELGRGTFGIFDCLPLIFYVLEIGTGIYVGYMIKKIYLHLNVTTLKNKYTKQVKNCSEFTSQSVSKFQKAETGQYSAVGSNVSDNVHEAHFRYKMRDLNKEEEYILPATKEIQSIRFVVRNPEGVGLVRHIDIVTEFKFSMGGTSDNQGVIVFDKLFTFRGDMVKDIFVRESSTSSEFKKIESSYLLNNEQAHVLIVL